MITDTYRHTSLNETVWQRRQRRLLNHLYKKRQKTLGKMSLRKENAIVSSLKKQKHRKQRRANQQQLQRLSSFFQMHEQSLDN